MDSICMGKDAGGIMAKSEQELIADLVIWREESERVLQKIFCSDIWADDDTMMTLLHTLQELRDKVVLVDAQLNKIANDSIADTVASLYDQ